MSLASIRGRLRRFSLDELRSLHASRRRTRTARGAVAVLDKRIKRVEQASISGSAGSE